MRAALLGISIAMLAGCPIQGDDCEVDSACPGGEVCARDHSCTSPSNVRQVKVLWTINGAPADPIACGDRDLFIEFEGRDRNDTLGFRPVPCFAGQFTVDKLPLRFVSVELGVEDGGDVDFASFDAEGMAQLDLSL
jgi:hypothetical protein